MKHLFDLKAYNLSIVSYGKQKFYWFSRVFYLLCNEKLKISSACLDLSLDMEGPAGNSAGHIDSLGFFFYLCNYLFPRRDLEQLQGMTAQHWQVTVSVPTPQTTATHPPWWQEWDYDAPEMQRSAKEHLSGNMGGDGGGARSISNNSLGWTCNTFIWICHYHDWLFKYLLCALQACKKKNPCFKLYAVLCYTATTQTAWIELPPHIFEHMCREMNYLPTWPGEKHGGVSPCLLLRWTTHPTQWGKTPLVRSSNQCNASPGAANHNFLGTKWRSDSFFWMANPF